MNSDKRMKLIQIYEQNIKTHLERTRDKTLIQKHVRSKMAYQNQILACLYCEEGQMLRAKMHFLFSAYCSEYNHYEINALWAGYNVKPYICALVSDSDLLIRRFANIELNHIEWDGDSRPATFNYAIQGLLKNDQHMISQSLQMYRDLYSKEDHKLWVKNHILAIESLIQKDKSGLEQAILGYEHKTIQKEMVKADICEEVVSFWGILWAKLGWMKGIDLKVDTQRVPVELLISRPLEEYTIPYWFLRDFYREQGVDWRYDPVHPELQDWDNDPENPNRKKGGFFGKLFNQ